MSDFFKAKRIFYFPQNSLLLDFQFRGSFGTVSKRNNILSKSLERLTDKFSFYETQLTSPFIEIVNRSKTIDAPRIHILLRHYESPINEEFSC